MNQIKVKIEYSWTFDKREWNEQKEHFRQVETDIKTKIVYDPLSIFHFMNDIIYPQVSAATVTQLEKSNYNTLTNTHPLEKSN